MKNFMIGQPGSFDYKKFNRDFKEDFYGIEACMFATEEDISNLIEESKSSSFNIGIHFPLRSWVSKLRDPQFLSKDEEVKNNSYKIIEEELEILKQVKPKYVLFHYPKPVILDTTVDWTNWRFADKSEYIFDTEYSFNELQEKSEYLFKWLTEKSEEYNFTPVLELDGLNKYIYETNLLEELLGKYPKIKLCIDTGRLHLQDRIDPNFNALSIIKRFSKYAEVVHLWNIRVKDNLENSHYPALKNLKAEDGWAPIEEYIRIIKEENKDVKIMFEHRSDLITDEELEECYIWINELMEG